MQNYKGVLKHILSNRGLSKPDATPLYSYKLTQEEFNELRQSLAASCRSNGIHTYVNKAPREWAACFVLYAAEWWRTSFQGGCWEWEPILASLGINLAAITPSQRSDIVVKGLVFWGRKVLSNTKGRMLLGTIAVEGGLPHALIQDSRNKLAHYFELVIHDYGQFASSQVSAMTIAKAHANQIVASFRDDTVYGIVAQVAESIYQLVDRHELDQQDDPLHYLNSVEPQWSQVMPLNLDHQTAQKLLGDALGKAVEVQRRLPNTLKVIRKLTKSYGAFASMADGEAEYQWKRKLEITLRTRLNAKYLQQLFEATDLPERLNLFAVGSKNLLLAKAFKRNQQSEYYLVDVYTKQLPEEWFSSDIQLKASDDLGRVWYAPLVGGAGFSEDEPWLFIEQNDQWLFKGAGNVSCEESQVLLSVPHGVDTSSLAQFEKERGCNERSLYRIDSTSELIVGDYLLRFGTDGVEALEYTLSGKAFGFETIPTKTFIGLPDVVAINDKGVKKVFPRHQLRWRNSDLGTWKSIETVPDGKVDIALFENNQLKKRFTIGLLPNDLTVAHEASKSVQVGRIALNAKSLPAVALIEPKGLEVLPSSQLHSGDQRCIDLASHEAHPPAYVSLSLWWIHQSRAIRTRLPFPSRGVCLNSSDGEAVNNGDEILIDHINRYELFGYGIQGQMDIEFKLQAQDVRGGFARTAYSKRSLPGGDILSSGLPLATFKEDVESLFALSVSLDALVKVTILASGNAQFSFVVSSYTNALSPNRMDNTITLEGTISPLPLLQMTPVDNPTHTPVLVKSDGTKWHFPDVDVEPGAWLVYADDPSQGVRPLMWSKQLELLDEPRNRLDKAASIGARNERINAFSEALAQLAIEPGAPEWEYVKALLAFGKVPLTAFDLWRGAVRAPKFLLALLLTANKQEVERVWQFDKQFPVFWYSLDVRKGIAVVEAFYQARLAAYGDEFSDIIRSQIEAKLNDLVARFPGFEFLVGQAMHKLDATRPKPSLAPPAYVQQLFELRNGLAQQYDEFEWPTEYANGILASVIRNVHPEFQRLCLTDKHLFRNNVMNAPVLVALASLGVAQLTMTPEVVHALRQYRSFDIDHFDRAFALTHQMALGLLNI
ncbi:STY4851/ECs_5259 family protein [Ferrimonas balearica]|uniref:STY4851/ECs_5259 family protein n=1 Tax=Ferrimonas balearica TaxID=44012 RepID=UPI001F1B50D9|nr:STY4851/ECs_5259 family protein [Ferrimonas balearica]MBY6093963.1 STY4851/ECs_5259 family protein [Ferrimonas balearica]